MPPIKTQPKNAIDRRALLIRAGLGFGAAGAGAGAGAGVGVVAPPEASGRRRRVCQRLLIPSYFYPGGAGPNLWNQAIAQAPTVKYLIANPNSGPGETKDEAYAAVINRAREAGISVLGYVATTYGEKPEAEVRMEIAKFREFYGVASYFFDESASSVGKLAYYRRLARFVRQKRGAKIVLNHGVVPATSGYLDAGDVLVTFENTAEEYLQDAAFPRWTRRAPAGRFAHLIHTTNAADMEEVVNRAHQRNAGFVYVTDDELPNPWDSLPPYFEDEVAAAKTNCRR